MTINPNWVLVGVTTVYTFATIAICWANWRSASAAKGQTEEMIRQYRDSKRARIAIRFDKKCVVDRNIVLKNVGKEDADEVSVSINHEFMEQLHVVWPDNLLTIVTSSTFHIAAGQEFWLFVGFADIIDKMTVTKANVKVNYQAAGECHQETATIDFSQYNFISEISNQSVSAHGHHWVDG